jgi:hypothetical protein
MLGGGIIIWPLRCRTIWKCRAEPLVWLHPRCRCDRRYRSARRRGCWRGRLRPRRARCSLGGGQLRDEVSTSIGRSTQQQLLPPSIELARGDAVLASHHRNRHFGLHPFSHDLVLLLGCPTPALATGAQLGDLAPSTLTIARTCVPRLRNMRRHAALFRYRRHLALTGPSQAT